MGTIIDITQYKLERALVNEEADAKLKLRNQSHVNLIQHVKNIPYMTTKGPKVGSSEVSLSEEKKDFNISTKEYMQLVMGSYKPINVKEDKLENIKKHSKMLVSVTNENEIVEQTKNISVEPPVTKQVNEVQSEVTQDNSQVVTTPEMDLVNYDKEIDISEYVAKVDNETQLLKKVKEEATIAQQEADDSDEKLNELSVEVSELEKQEQEAERKSIELNRAMASSYENNIKIMAIVRQQAENLIQEANARKQANQDKILQFQTRIEGIREHITEVNESNARKQEILAALQQNEFTDNIVQLSNINDSEEKVKKIA